MTKLCDYEPGAVFCQKGRTSILHAVHAPTRQPVILKTLACDYAAPEDTIRLQYEYKLMQTLQLPAVLRADRWEMCDGSFFIVLEPFEGICLQDWIPYLHDMPLASSIESILTFAIQLAEALEGIHDQHIVHNRIIPSNILINSANLHIKLVDFSHAARLKQTRYDFHRLDTEQQDIAYLSPEQSGRMNRNVDRRTDFYSMGVILYEMLTGRLPFTGRDALEIAYGHIAKVPVSPHELEPQIPLPLSQMVLKLLAKETVERYQSAAGLKADLLHCLQQWHNKQSIDLFVLGKKERMQDIQFLQSFYGRKEEIEAMQRVFDSLAQGSRDFILISGSPGIGKTTMVQEFFRSQEYGHGYFTSGKYNEGHPIPLVGITQAVCGLVQSILSQSSQHVALWRKKINETLGSNSRIIIDLCPDMEHISGQQPALPDLTAAETENRFLYTLNQFFSLFSLPHQPLIIFLDDLQWADEASLKIIEQLMYHFFGSSLLFIGACRSEETSAVQNLFSMISDIEKQGIDVSRIHLQPLNESEVTDWLADICLCGEGQVASLARLAIEKTGGSPLFLLEYMRSLYEQRLFAYDEQTGGWHWDEERIRSVHTGENVVELAAARAGKLEPDELRTLEAASAIGATFDLATLAQVCMKTPQQTAQLLEGAITARLVLPVSEMQHYIAHIVLGSLNLNYDEIAAGMHYRFVHDRIRQAVYEHIPSAQVLPIHERIGRVMLQSVPPEKRDQVALEAAHHLNQTRSLMDSEDKSRELAWLNLAAGKKAKAAAAYRDSLHYLETALALLKEDAWGDAYELTLALHTEAAEAAYLSAEHRKMEEHFQQVVSHARSRLEQARLYEIKVQSLTMQTRVREAVQTALEGLKLLDIELPGQPQQSDVDGALQMVSQALAGRRIDELSELPAMTDSRVIAAMRILSGMGSPAHITSSELFLLVSLKQVELSLLYGNAAASSVAYSLYALILCSASDIDNGYAFGQLALKVLEKFNAHGYRAMVLQLVAIAVQHWKESIRSLIPVLTGAYHAGIESGDVVYASYSALQLGIHALFSGMELESVERIFSEEDHAISILNQETALQWNRIYHQAVLNLLGKSPDPLILQGERYDEQKMLPQHQKDNNRTSLFLVFFMKQFLCILLQQPALALQHAETARQYLDGVAGFLLVPEFVFYDSLARLKVCENLPAGEQQRNLEIVQENQQQLEQWQRHAPMNYRNKYILVEAELARLQCAFGSARELYDEAVELSARYELLYEEALANELAAGFYFNRSRPALGRFYLQQSVQAYARWGAEQKLKQLHEQYPLIIEETGLQQPVYRELDLAAVIRTAQAISEEIVLKKLLEKVIKILAQNAGAQRGFLLLEQDGKLFVEAGIEDGSKTFILQSLPLEDTREKLCVAVVNFTIHTKEALVLSSAFSEGAFTADEYIQSNQIRSLLCTPVMAGGKLIGILYLENNLLANCFTSERVALLGMLASQAAVSIENAHIYNNLEALVESRTQELEHINASLLQEITERMRTEEAMRQSEARFRGIFNATALGIGLVNERGQLFQSNLALQKMLGYSAEELNSMNYTEYNHPDDIEKTNAYVQLLLDGKMETVQYEKRFIRKDGAIVWVRMTPSMVFDVDGRPLYGINVVEDIRQQKQLQEALIQSEKMAGLGTLAAGLAHELNSPLQVITGSCESALKRLKQGEKDEKQFFSDFETILRNGWRIADIIKALLTYARVSSMELEPKDVNELIRETLLLLQQETATWAKIAINTELAVGLPQLMCDASLVSQALGNLLENAHDALPQGGKITVRSGLSKERECIYLQVEDNGSGIPINIRSRIFDPFFTTKPVGEGTGLGLSVVMGIVQAHAGSVDFESKPGSGSVFTLYFPRDIPEQEFNGAPLLGRY